jgi:ubiquinone/menaquinone biosynthesis C-methylase UbiE
MSTEQRYVPAAGRAWLTALYDPLMALTMRERAFRPALIATVLAEPRPSVVLDVGCGTGTLAGQLAEADPSLRVLGMDGDEEVLALARQKVTGFGERVRFSESLADALPVEDASVDVVIASAAAPSRTCRKARRLERGPPRADPRRTAGDR